MEEAPPVRGDRNHRFIGDMLNASPQDLSTYLLMRHFLVTFNDHEDLFSRRCVHQLPEPELVEILLFPLGGEGPADKVTPVQLRRGCDLGDPPLLSFDLFTAVCTLGSHVFPYSDSPCVGIYQLYFFFFHPPAGP